MSKFIVSELRKYLKTCEHTPSMVTGLILGAAIGPDLVHEVLGSAIGSDEEPITYNSYKDDYIDKWRAKKYRSYYYVDSDGDILQTFENNSDVDDERYNTGNYYKTRQDAERRKNND